MLASFLFWKLRAIETFLKVIKTTEETAAEGGREAGSELRKSEILCAKLCGNTPFSSSVFPYNIPKTKFGFAIIFV